MRRRYRLRVPPPPLSLFILLLALVLYGLMIPDLRRAGERMKQLQHTAEVCATTHCEHQTE